MKLGVNMLLWTTRVTREHGGVLRAIKEAGADGVESLRRFIGSAHELRASVLCGPMYQTLGHFTGQGATESELNHAADLLACVADEAQQAKIMLAVEPLNRFECHLLNTLADGAAFVDRVAHPNVGVLYDTFHAHIEEKNPTAR